MKPPYGPPRDARRVACEQQVVLELSTARKPIFGVTFDLSVKGMFVRTAFPLNLGTPLSFTLLLDEKSIKGQGAVRWVRARDQGEERPAGMGIEFAKIGKGDVKLLGDLLDRLAAAGARDLGSLETSAEPRPVSWRPVRGAGRASPSGSFPRIRGLQLTARVKVVAMVTLLVVVAGVALAFAPVKLGRWLPFLAEGDEASAASGSQADAALFGDPSAEAALRDDELPVAAARPATGSFTGLDDIQWSRQGRVLVVTLRGDGPIAQLSRVRLESGGVREVIRLGGAKRPYSTAAMRVGQPELDRIRTGYHSDPSGDELHVVLDLTGPDIEITDLKQQGAVVRLELVRRAP